MVKFKPYSEGEGPAFSCQKCCRHVVGVECEELHKDPHGCDGGYFVDVKEPYAEVHQRMIDAELDKAIAKHPKFCGGFTYLAPDPVKTELHFTRMRVDVNHMADDILHEENLEAVEAYVEGRLEDYIVELAKCGAVVRRMITFVQAEIDAKKGGAS